MFKSTHKNSINKCTYFVRGNKLLPIIHNHNHLSVWFWRLAFYLQCGCVFIILHMCTEVNPSERISSAVHKYWEGENGFVLSLNCGRFGCNLIRCLHCIQMQPPCSAQIPFKNPARLMCKPERHFSLGILIKNRYHPTTAFYGAQLLLQLYSILL